MRNEQPTSELQAELGKRLRAARLAANLPQETLADKAQISRGSLQALERGAGSQLETFLRVLKALGLADRLEAVVDQEADVSPMQLLKQSQGHIRQRARPKRTP